MSAAAILARECDELISLYGGEGNEAEISRAREEYAERRGRVVEDDEEWESATQAFLEWYVVERPWKDTGSAPARLHADRVDEPERVAALLALASSQRCLVEIVGKTATGLDVMDLVGGAAFYAHEERSLVGLNQGDVVELRLFGFQEQVMMGRTFVFHPDGCLEAIRSLVDRLREQRQSRADIIDRTALLRSRTKSYRHVAPARIYQNDGQLAGAS